jgi:hypothetical protein
LLTKDWACLFNLGQGLSRTLNGVKVVKSRSLLEVSLLAAMATVGLVAIVQVVGEAAAQSGFTFESTLPQPNVMLRSV